jgi:hypothetical protein
MNRLDVREQLKRLMQLQKIELRIMRIDKERKQLQSRRTSLSEKLTSNQRKLSQYREKLKEVELLRRQRELELKSEVEKVKRWEKRLPEVKNSKEYQALVREIASTKKSNSELEDEVLKLMEQGEEIQQNISSLQRQVDSLKEQFGKEDESIARQIEDLKQQIENEESLKRNASSGIDPSLLSKYETISKRRNGIAITPVKDCMCLGCNMKIPPQIYNEVQKFTSIQFCPMCNRIICYEVDSD